MATMDQQSSMIGACDTCRKRVRAYFSNERLAEWGAFGVLAGIALEVVLAWVFRTDKSLWEEWGPMTADVLIAVGVFVEIYFGRRASEESAERVSQANERAASAELAAETLRAQYAWRRLSAVAAKRMSGFLNASFEELGEPHGMRHLLVTYFGSDPEASNFAHELGSVFSQCGWTVGYVSASYVGPIRYGLLIPDARFSTSHLDKVARAAILDAGFQFEQTKLPHRHMTNPERGPLIAQWAVQVYVGPRPMPELT